MRLIGIGRVNRRIDGNNEGRGVTEEKRGIIDVSN
jgi:hypothetical protein